MTRGSLQGPLRSVGLGARHSRGGREAMNPQQFATYGAQHHGRTGSAAFSAQYATAGRTTSMGGGGMMSMPLSTWAPPSQQELHYYDSLFAVADEEKRNVIGGRIAVAFFSRSKVDKAHLREIWTIADSQQRSELSRNEFYVAMRLISMAQRGEPVAAQRFFELASAPYPLPTIEGIALPVTPSQQSVPSSLPPVGAMKGPYAITGEEKLRYDGIFQQYDSDQDGFLHGGEAVQLFGMSGLDRAVLRDIWALADRGQDSRLDIKEFYVAMHLIVCVSKRGLPLPAELPAELAASVFGESESFTSTTQVPLTPSRTSSISAPPTTIAPPTQIVAEVGDPMDAFAGLSAGSDIPSQPSRVGSFGRATSVSSHSGAIGALGSLPSATVSHESASVSVTATPMAPNPPPVPLPLNGGFQGASFGGLDSSLPVATGIGPNGMSERARERVNSGSSVSSFTSVSTDTGVAHSISMLPPHGSPPVPAGGSFRGSMAMGTQMNTSQLPHLSPAPASIQTVMKPFLADEAESSAVRQLQQSNEELVKALECVETKQDAIQLLTDKLRELDQLRHELVTLSTKRDAMRSAAASAQASSGPPRSSSDTAAVRAVEHTIQTLINGEKTLIQRLQADISRYEADLVAQAPAGGDVAPPTLQPQDSIVNAAPAASDAFAAFEFN